MATSFPSRLPPQPQEQIDRASVLHFAFNGRDYTAHPGDTIGSALAAAGVRVLSRSFKYHRPRGLLCVDGYCPNCMVQVGDEPNVRACRTLVQEGMRVTSQNAWPSLRLDLMSFTQWISRFLPVGFYYKTFIHPRRLWPVYEWVLRHAAGLGRVSRQTPPAHYQHAYLHAEVVVVGGGPAGLSAALAAAQHGVRVVLCDSNPRLGGHLNHTAGAAPTLAALVREVEKQPNLQVLTRATVLGWYPDHWLGVRQEVAPGKGKRLFKVRARSVVIAAGAYETPLLFENNDLPGIILGSGVQRLVHQYGVVPGKRAVVASANDEGWEVAADLRAAGVEVAAVVEARPESECASPQRAELVAAGVPIFWEHALTAAHGADGVRRAEITRVGALAPRPPMLGVSSVTGGEKGLTQSIDCDLIAVSVGWTPATELLSQAGAHIAYVEARGEFLPQSLPPGVYAAGRVLGIHSLAAEIESGRSAGEQAAMWGAGEARQAHARMPGRPEEKNTAVSQSLGSLSRGLAGSQGNSTLTRRMPERSSSGKRFVCYCEDVTDHDLETAIAEGYDHVELLKRYSTLSMGPCQGKLCSAQALHLCARETGVPVQQVGSTTARPPMMPTEMGVLAGPHLEPVQKSPAHEWHVAHGGRMILAGAWLRPDHYGDPAAEIRAVRERVGLIDVSMLGKIRVAGPGAVDLLEHVYINRWRGLEVGRARYGAMCNDEGVVLDDGVCARVAPQEWYLSASTLNAGAIFEWLQWWIQSGAFAPAGLGRNVRTIDLTEAYFAYNLAGPQARAVLQKLTPLDVSNAAFPYMHVREAVVAGVPCRLLRIGFTGELAYEIHGPTAHGLGVWEALLAAGEEFGILPYGVEALRVTRLEKAHLLVGYDTDAVADALSAGLGWAVKLDKPDFVGKRSLARLAASGPPRRLTGFRVTTPGAVPDEGLQIIKPGPRGKLESIGYITSCRYSAALGEAIGLCWLPAEVAVQNGAPLTIRLLNGTGTVQAVVHHGAFYDPEGKRLRS